MRRKRPKDSNSTWANPFSFLPKGEREVGLRGTRKVGIGKKRTGIGLILQDPAMRKGKKRASFLFGKRGGEEREEEARDE